MESLKNFSKKDALIEAAIDEFSTCSFDVASLNVILDKASISKGNFYYHFKNKDDLYIYIIGLFLKKKKTYIINNMTKRSQSNDLFSVLKSNIELGLKFGSENPKLLLLSERLMKERGNAIYDKVFSFYNLNQDDYINHLIETSIINKELRDDIPKDIVKSIISHILVNVHSLLDIHDMEDYKSKISYLFEFLQYGLKK